MSIYIHLHIIGCGGKKEQVELILWIGWMLFIGCAFVKTALQLVMAVGSI